MVDRKIYQIDFITIERFYIFEYRLQDFFSEAETNNLFMLSFDT